MIAENDLYGLIPNFDPPHWGFLPFQIVGENPACFFSVALQNNIEVELKYISSFEAR